MEAAVTVSPGVQIRVFQDEASLSRAAAEFITAAAKQSVAAKGRCSVALSGGSTPKRLYSLLGSLPYREAIPWPQVHVFWADERCVPPDHAESNFKLASDAFLSEVPLPAGNIHRIRAEEGPGKAARAYEEDLRTFFGSGAPAFDLVLLGAGEDGHTASLFPGSPALEEKERISLPVYLERPQYDRVTLTLPALNHASHVVFLAMGRAKSGVVSAILEEKNPQRFPAGLVQPQNGDISWFLDKEAAEKLKVPVSA